MWSSYENIWTFLIIVLMALITPDTVTVYRRDQLLTLRSSPALLNHRVCLQVSQLGLLRRGCPAGKRWSRRLLAARSVTSSVRRCAPGEIPTIIGYRAAVINSNQLINRHDVHGTSTDAKQCSSSHQLAQALQPHARPPLSVYEPKVPASDFSSCDSDTFSISTRREVTHMGSQSTSSTTLTASSILSSSVGPGDLKTSSSAVQQFRSSPPSSAAAVLPMWSPAVTVSGVSSSLVQTTMSSSLSAIHQPSLPSSPMSSTALLPSLSVAAVWSTSLRSTPAAPTTTVTLLSTTTGVCQSGATPPPRR